MNHARLCLFTLMCLALALVRSEPVHAVNTGFIWGVNGHPIVSYPDIALEDQLAYINQLGMTSYRVDVVSADQLDKLRRIVQAAKPHGITILPVVTPSFDFDQTTAAALRDQAYELAFALVSGLKGEVPVWELGNELENYAIIKPCERRDDGKIYSCTYGPAGGTEVLDYFGPRWEKVSAVLKGLTEGAKAADPNVRRAVGTAGWGHTGAVQRMHDDGIAWEITVWHMYGEDPEWALKRLAKFDRPIWLTEFNHPLGSQPGKDKQARGLLEAMERLVALRETYRIEAAHIYELMDEPYWGDHYEAFMGLVEVPGPPKPAFHAVKERIEADGARARVPVASLIVARDCLLPTARPDAPLDFKAKVAYAYCLLLGRAADAVGQANYAQRLAAGLSVEELLVDLAGSDEFEQRYRVRESTNVQYAALLNELLLGTSATRAADLQVKPRDEMLHTLVASEAFRSAHPALVAQYHAQAPTIRRRCNADDITAFEYPRSQVIYGFCVVMGRWPDPYGLHTWTDELRSGMSIEQFLIKMMQSHEFEIRYGVSALSDQAFRTFASDLLLGDGGAGASAASTEGKPTRLETYQSIIASDAFRSRHPVLFSAALPEARRGQKAAAPR